MQLLLGSMRKGGLTEAGLAARGLALLAVTLGAGEEAAHLLRESLASLLDTAKTGRTPKDKRYCRLPWLSRRCVTRQACGSSGAMPARPAML